MIRLLAETDAAQRATIITALDSADADCNGALDGWFASTDALGYTRDKARWFADLARAELAHLPASDARSVLESVAEFAIERQH